MHCQIKYILKNNRHHTSKQALNVTNEITTVTVL